MRQLKEMKTPKKLMAFIVSAALLLSLSSVAAIADTESSEESTSVETEESVTVSEEETTTSEEESTTIEEETTTIEEESTTVEEETTTAEDSTTLVGAKITVDGYIYKISEDNTVILKGFASGESKTKVVVKNKITYNDVTYKVVKVGAGAFRDETGIKKVLIRKNTTDIAKNAFRGCTSLTKVTIRTGE